MPRGAERNPLLLHRRIRNAGVIGRNKPRHVDQHCQRGRLASQGTYFYWRIFCVNHRAPPIRPMTRAGPAPRVGSTPTELTRITFRNKRKRALISLLT